MMILRCMHAWMDALLFRMDSCCSFFASTTSVDWLTTCVLALLVEAFIQQPASLLATGVLGDFIEEGAILLADLQ